MAKFVASEPTAPLAVMVRLARNLTILVPMGALLVYMNIQHIIIFTSLSIEKMDGINLVVFLISDNGMKDTFNEGTQKSTGLLVVDSK